MRITISLLFLGLLSAPIFAQQETESWTLDRCITYAIDNNLTVQIQELSTELNEYNVKQAKGSMLPNLNGFASYNVNYGQRIDPFTNQFAVNSVPTSSIYLSSNWTIFSGLQNLNTVKQAQYNYMSSTFDLEATKYDIAMVVTGAYLSILFYEEQVRVAREQLDVAQQQVDRTKLLYEAGSVPKGDYLDVVSQLANEELNLTNIENNLQLAYLDLKQTLMLSSEQNIEIVVPPSDLQELALPPNPSLVVESAYQNYPSIKARENDVLSADKGVSIAKGFMSPTLTANASIGSGYSGNNRDIVSATPTGQVDTLPYFTLPSYEYIVQPGFDIVYEDKSLFDQWEENFNQAIGLSLAIPIFNRFNTSTNISQAKIRLEMAESDLIREKQRVRQSVEKAYADASAALKSYLANQRSLEALEESFKYAEERFNVGMINAVDYNLAKNNLNRARSLMIQSKYDYVFKMELLKLYEGTALNYTNQEGDE